jgi:signal transduction histidine kinase
MITAMVKLPDGKVLNKILSKDADDITEAILEGRVRRIMTDCVTLVFDDMEITAHAYNIILTTKNSQ